MEIGGGMDKITTPFRRGSHMNMAWIIVQHTVDWAYIRRHMRTGVRATRGRME